MENTNLQTSTDRKTALAQNDQEKFATATDYLKYKEKENEDFMDAVIRGTEEAFAEMAMKKTA